MAILHKTIVLLTDVQTLATRILTHNTIGVLTGLQLQYSLHTIFLTSILVS
ncbi:hypothetical protein [Mucilaginibacter sp. FT3.2]|uniref:hypothetical protein n=1 Tax=Mucilaginibacter sp. FT3.2 TaxID=2723090 RepID=UPI0016182ADC|nr:hypothetical protein [Mucilaginibacter sp. FT3.2]MBB6233250.1 hypothetical protein [Mucilaginibacter sp. FT3.2]